MGTVIKVDGMTIKIQNKSTESLNLEDYQKSIESSYKEFNDLIVTRDTLAQMSTEGFGETIKNVGKALYDKIIILLKKIRNWFKHIIREISTSKFAFKDNIYKSFDKNNKFSEEEIKTKYAGVCLFIGSLSGKIVGSDKVDLEIFVKKLINAKTPEELKSIEIMNPTDIIDIGAITINSLGGLGVAAHTVISLGGKLLNLLDKLQILIEHDKDHKYEPFLNGIGKISGELQKGYAQAIQIAKQAISDYKNKDNDQKKTVV